MHAATSGPGRIERKRARGSRRGRRVPLAGSRRRFGRFPVLRADAWVSGYRENWVPPATSISANSERISLPSTTRPTRTSLRFSRRRTAGSRPFGRRLIRVGPCAASPVSRFPDIPGSRGGGSARTRRTGHGPGAGKIRPSQVDCLPHAHRFRRQPSQGEKRYCTGRDIAEGSCRGQTTRTGRRLAGTSGAWACLEKHVEKRARGASRESSHDLARAVGFSARTAAIAACSEKELPRLRRRQPLTATGRFPDNRFGPRSRTREYNCSR